MSNERPSFTEAPLEQVVRLLETACDAPPLAVDALQRYGLASLLTATPATLDLISAKSGVSADELRAGVDGLKAAGRIEMEGSRVVGIGGLTLSATDHTLSLTAATIHTWCALDAVGIPAALDLDAEVSTSCPHCRDLLHIEIRSGEPDHNEKVRLFCPTAPCSDVRADFCSAANLFCSAEHLSRWADSHTIEGTELDLDATAELGRAVWETHRHTSTESEAD